MKNLVDFLPEQSDTTNKGAECSTDMAKSETIKKQKSAVKKSVEHSYDLLNATDSEQVSEALLECIRVGDLDSFRDVLTAHITSSNKLRLAKKAGIGRQTLYDLIDPRRTFNPELTTISAIFRALAT